MYVKMLILDKLNSIIMSMCLSAIFHNIATIKIWISAIVIKSRQTYTPQIHLNGTVLNSKLSTLVLYPSEFFFLFSAHFSRHIRPHRIFLLFSFHTKIYAFCLFYLLQLVFSIHNHSCVFISIHGLYGFKFCYLYLNPNYFIIGTFFP